MLKLTLNHKPAGQTLQRRLGHWLVAGALLGFGAFAIAQAEPTLNQVYETAQSGKLDQAQLMMQQVLVAHPNSGKAHFVQAELFARAGNVTRAREALANAEKLTPGLAFAKPEAVQALRAQLSGNGSNTNRGSGNAVVNGSGSSAGNNSSSGNASMSRSQAAAAPASSFPWGLALAGGGALIAVGLYMSRKKNNNRPGDFTSPNAYAGAAVPAQNGLNGPQGFGLGNAVQGGMPGGAPGGMPGATGYGQPGYPPAAASSGMGSKIMGGVATGLAVGAGVMAAQAIAKGLSGHDNNNGNTNTNSSNDTSGNWDNNNAGNSNTNTDMGGSNFGVSGADSWDDGSSSSGGGGGDWDN